MSGRMDTKNIEQKEVVYIERDRRILLAIGIIYTLALLASLLFFIAGVLLGTNILLLLPFALISLLSTVSTLVVILFVPGVRTLLDYILSNNKMLVLYYEPNSKTLTLKSFVKKGDTLYYKDKIYRLDKESIYRFAKGHDIVIVVSKYPKTLRIDDIKLIVKDEVTQREIFYEKVPLIFFTTDDFEAIMKDIESKIKAEERKIAEESRGFSIRLPQKIGGIPIEIVVLVLVLIVVGFLALKFVGNLRLPIG